MSEPKEVSGLEAAVNTALEQIPLPANIADQCERYEDTHQRKLDVLRMDVNNLPDITDKDTRQVNQSMLTKLKSIRTGMDSYRKAVFAPMRVLKEKFDAYIGTTADAGLQAKVKAMEEVIEAKQKVWDDAQEEIRRKAQQLIDQRNQQRAQILMDMSFHYDGLTYTLGSLTKKDSDLRTEADATFERFVLTAKPEAERHKRKAARIEELKAVGYEETECMWQVPGVDVNGPGKAITEDLADMPDETFAELVDMGRREQARRAELKRLEAEQNERNRLAFEEQGRKQRENDEERARIDRERAQLREDKMNHRLDALEELGAAKTSTGIACGEWSIEFAALADLADDAWKVLKESVKRIAEEGRRKLDELNAMAQRKEHRAGLLTELGAFYDGDSVWTLGEATTTDKLLATMDDCLWDQQLISFQLEHERLTSAPVQVIDEEEPPVVPMREQLLSQQWQDDCIEACAGPAQCLPYKARKDAAKQAVWKVLIEVDRMIEVGELIVAK